MGGDGGTIPKRKDRVKTNTKSQPKSKYNIEGRRDPLERWKFCPISGLPIKRPVMSGRWGHILSKEGVIEYLLKRRADTLESYHICEDTSPVCDALHKMSDVIELKLKDNPALIDSDKLSEEKYNMGDFICPITGLETNGKHKFVFSWKCGCVISERALKECDNDPKMEVKKCLVCEKPYHPCDLVLINPVTYKELSENQSKFAIGEMIRSSFISDESVGDLHKLPAARDRRRRSTRDLLRGSNPSTKQARSPTLENEPSTSNVPKRSK